MGGFHGSMYWANYIYHNILGFENHLTKAVEFTKTYNWFYIFGLISMGFELLKRVLVPIYRLVSNKY